MKKIGWITGILLVLVLPLKSRAQFPFFGDSKKPKGKIRSFTESCYETSSGGMVLVQKETFVYDDRGKLVEQKIYNTLDSLKPDYSIVYAYDGEQLIEELADGRFKVRYLYDDAGNKIARKYTSDSLRYLDRFDYDEEKRLVLRNRYNGEGKLSGLERYSYNEQNWMIRKHYLDYDSAANSRTIAYSYDNATDINQERVYAGNGKNLYMTSYFYGMHTDLTEQSRYSENGNLIWRRTFRYTYDKPDNWIRMEMKITGGTFLTRKGSFVTRREIQYR